MPEFESSLTCIVTNEGINKSQEAANRAGWYIYPTGFAISDSYGELSADRKDIKPTWYNTKISSRRIIDENTIEFSCSIPPNAYLTSKPIKEVYLLAEDKFSNSFILCIGQPKDLTFYPDIGIKLNIIVNILSLNIVATYVIKDTVANDLQEHNADLNAHPDIISRIDKLSGDCLVTSDENFYDLKAGETLFVDSTYNRVNVYLPEDDLVNGDKVTIVDIAYISNLSNIIIKAGSKRIELNSIDLILNVAGAKVTLIWYTRLKSWFIDTSGRHTNIQFREDERSKPIYYNQYFPKGIDRYDNSYNYIYGDIVIGENLKLYQAMQNNGPFYEKIESPGEQSSCWVSFSNKKETKVLTNIQAHKDMIVPFYIKGRNNIHVYLDGLLCKEGIDSEICTYYEDTGVREGQKTNVIIFHDDIPDTMTVFVEVG